MKAFIVLFACCFLFLPNVNAQLLVAGHGLKEGHDMKHARVSGMVYHTYIGTETSEGMNFLVVPSLGLDLEYWFNEKWGVGMHNDMELVNFEIIKESEVIFHRETPLLLTLDCLWKPNKAWVFLLGPGLEIEKNEELMVLRGGVEYEIELNHHFDVCPALFYDIRSHAYDTFSFGIGIGKRF